MKDWSWYKEMNAISMQIWYIIANDQKKGCIKGWLESSNSYLAKNCAILKSVYFGQE